MEPELSHDQNLYKAAEMKKMLQTAEMALWVDGYDDIFSDFDPRPYTHRTISDDFLSEMKIMAKDRGKESFELKFLMSPELRNYNHEQVIKERLREHFGKYYHYLLKEKKKVIRMGLVFVSLGILLMFVSTLVAFLYFGKHFLFNFVVALTEPAGWFLFWEGLVRGMYDAKKLNPDISFYNKMARSKITFISY